MGWLEEHSTVPIRSVKASKKASRKAAKTRKDIQKQYDQFHVESSEVDGLVFRSRLEALWYDELKDCDSLTCFECVQVPLWIEGSNGRFLGEYSPDFCITLVDGSTVYVELKPNHKLAVADDRQKRALEINPKQRFVVIGGYPYSKRGVTVRMLFGKKEEIHKNVQVCDVLRFLGCD